MNELISVIVPVYNTGAYLVPCMESLLDQTHQNIEIILVDDGSTDGSGAVCDEFARRDKRIRVIHQKNGGVSTARNAGLDQARGDYLFFLDSDDLLMPESLAVLCQRMEKHALVSGSMRQIDEAGLPGTDGLDLLITNIFINATSMGVLSLAKTVPSLITGLMGTVVNVFSPNFTILYAENKHEELFASVRQSMKIMGLMTNLPIIVLIVCGQEFFRLWQPTQDARALQILGLLSIGVLVFSGGINCLYNIFTVVNKIRLNSLVVLGTSFFGAICTLILLKTTSLGIYAVAGTSTMVALFRNLLFTAPYGAKCLNRKWYVFYPDIFRPALFCVISSLVCMAVLRFTAQGWLILACKACCTCALSGAIGFFLLLNQNDRSYLLGILRRIIRKH